MRRIIGAAVAVFFVAVAPVAGATPAPTNDTLGAEALFDEARRLLAAGSYAEACAKFAASHRLEPAVGTLLNLGDCHERRGLLATAWKDYREAISLAAARNDEERAKVALASAATLEPRLGHIRLHVAGDVTVLRDGAVVDPALFDNDVPVDAGVHLVEARAAGMRPWRRTVETKDRLTTRVDVPVLENDVAPPPPRAERPEHPEKGGAQRTLGLLVAGVGVVGLGIGVGFGLSARAKWNVVSEACPNRSCPSVSAREAVEGAHDDAGRAATMSTVAFVVGGVLLAGGGVLFFTSSRATGGGSSLRVAPAVASGAAGVLLGGAIP